MPYFAVALASLLELERFRWTQGLSMRRAEEIAQNSSELHSVLGAMNGEEIEIYGNRYRGTVRGQYLRRGGPVLL